MIVVDGNVIAYLLIEGPETEAVERLLHAEPEWAAPLLWRSEWRSVLAGYLRRGDLVVRLRTLLGFVRRCIRSGRVAPPRNSAAIPRRRAFPERRIGTLGPSTEFGDGPLDHAAALECLDTAEALVQGREYLVDGASVLALVESSPCSAYDCEYVALADTLGVPLVTYDRQVLTAFPDRAKAPAEHVAR